MINATEIYVLKETYSHLNNGQIISSNVLSSSHSFDKLLLLLNNIIKQTYLECSKDYTISSPFPQFYDIAYAKALKSESVNMAYRFDIIKIPVIS